ncbi:hypothetical protein JOB18_026286 [Solea senegalensis]|uniref:Uncharacterized protein n=1 Tax=Solea senegalensis TaxID=28829 RepID=A0AAV6R688_SOLSE|nr:hypothetical protein JOB18_026286 [Solea senegalensis]
MELERLQDQLNEILVQFKCEQLQELSLLTAQTLDPDLDARPPDVVCPAPSQHLNKHPPLHVIHVQLPMMEVAGPDGEPILSHVELSGAQCLQSFDAFYLFNLHQPASAQH